METGGYSLRCGFVTKDSQPFTVEINMFLLIVLLEYIILRLLSEWYGVYHSFRGVVNGSGRMKFFIHDGDGISKWHEIVIFSLEKS